jgi:hypothetical protein
MLFAGNIAYYALLFWLAEIRSFPHDLFPLATFFLPPVLTLVAALWLYDRPVEKFNWQQGVALFSSVVIPYIVLAAFFVVSMEICLRVQKVGCWL